MLEEPGRLQATAVHDAYLRLVDVEQGQKVGLRGHFFAAAAKRAAVLAGWRKRSQRPGRLTGSPHEIRSSRLRQDILHFAPVGSAKHTSSDDWRILRFPAVHGLDNSSLMRRFRPNKVSS
jgi:hypothetical protein